MQAFISVMLLVIFISVNDVSCQSNSTTDSSNSTMTTAAASNDTTTTAIAASTSTTAPAASNSAQAQNDTTTTTTTASTTTAKSEIVNYKLEFKIEMNVSNVDFTNTSSSTYTELEKNCSESLFDQFNKTVKGLKSVTITKLSPGSLNIEFVLVINSTENSNYQSSVTNGVAAISTNIVIGGVSFKSLTDPCTLLASVCTSSQTCVKDSNNQASCIAKSSSTKIPLMASLVVGLPLFASWWTMLY